MTDHARLKGRLQRGARRLRDSVASYRASGGAMGADDRPRGDRPQPEPAFESTEPSTDGERAELRELRDDLAAELARMARGGRAPS